MALDFPASPSNGQVFTSGGTSWSYDGNKWTVVAGSVEPVYISSTTPAGVDGQIYWDSDESTAYIYYTDGNGTSQWVPLTSTGPSIFDAGAIVSGTLSIARGGTGITDFDPLKIENTNGVLQLTETSGPAFSPTLSYSSTDFFGSTLNERLRIAQSGAIGLAGSNYGTDGQCLTSTGSGSTPEWRTPPLSNRNIVDNPKMEVAQRGTSESGLVDSPAFVVDRWSYRRAGAWGTNSFTMSQETSGPPDGFSYYLRLTQSGTAAAVPTDTFCSFNQRIEAINLVPFNNGTTGTKEFTVSWYARGSRPGTYCMALGAVNSANSGTSWYVCEYTLTTSWQRFTHTVPAQNVETFGQISYINQHGIDLYFIIAADGDGTLGSATAGSWHSTDARFTANQEQSFASTAGATFDVTGVQIELGGVATPFEHRSYGDELARCQRYYEVIDNEWRFDGNIGGNAATAGYMTYFKATKRASSATVTVTAESGSNCSNVNNTNVKGKDGVEVLFEWQTTGVVARNKAYLLAVDSEI